RIDNLDPLHGKTIHLPTTIEQVAVAIPQDHTQQSSYCQKWLQLEKIARTNIDCALKSLDQLYEGKVAWLLSQTLPSGTPIFFANSMSVRYAEYFWQPNQSRIAPYFSRGANGIDGTLSTALGIAYQDRAVLLTGDLALLHDTNGFLLTQQFQGHLTIIVINNNGGGIFELLPIANFPSFETYFAMPQTVKLSQLCAAYSIEHLQIDSWQQLTNLTKHLPSRGIRVLEVICDRHADALWLKENLPSFGNS
ncbi:MAG: thiamine pyrophosphate-dependent enzyme, partial [Cyanobacteria bacterium P01_C01_bin.72]